MLSEREVAEPVAIIARVTDDDVIVQRDFHYARRPPELLCDRVVCKAWRGVSRGVVMHQNDAASGGHNRRSEHFTRMRKRRLQRPE